MVRLYARNPIDDYPGWLKAHAEALHAIQYLGYRGLLHYAGMTEEQAADFFVQQGFPKFTEDVAGKVKREKHLKVIQRLLLTEVRQTQSPLPYEMSHF